MLVQFSLKNLQGVSNFFIHVIIFATSTDTESIPLVLTINTTALGLPKIYWLLSSTNFPIASDQSEQHSGTSVGFGLVVQHAYLVRSQGVVRTRAGRFSSVASYTLGIEDGVQLDSEVCQFDDATSKSLGLVYQLMSRASSSRNLRSKFLIF